MAIGELRYKGILFGDDLWGTVVDELPPKKNKQGIEMKKYLIIPSEDLVEAYPDILKKKDALNIKTPLGDAVWVEYPTFHVVDENPSKKNAIARIDCSFDGDDSTPFCKRYSKLTKQIERLKREVEELRVADFVDSETRREKMADIKKYAEHIAEVNQILKKGDRSGQDDIPEQFGLPEQ